MHPVRELEEEPTEEVGEDWQSVRSRVESFDEGWSKCPRRENETADSFERLSQWYLHQLLFVFYVLGP